jgi:hypothetical protein
MIRSERYDFNAIRICENIFLSATRSECSGFVILNRVAENHRVVTFAKIRGLGKISSPPLVSPRDKQCTFSSGPCCNTSHGFRLETCKSKNNTFRRKRVPPAVLCAKMPEDRFRDYVYDRGSEGKVSDGREE